MTKLVGKASEFDIDAALCMMLAYYESWQGREYRLFDQIGINDTEILRHLRTNIVQDKTSSLLSVSISEFPNESGYFMLWELSVSDDEIGKRVIPLYCSINSCI